MKAEDEIKVYRFHEAIALNLEHHKTIYIKPEDALALAEELKRFANGIENNIWYGTRKVKDGVAFNQANRKIKPIIIS